MECEDNNSEVIQDVQPSPPQGQNAQSQQSPHQVAAPASVILSLGLEQVSAQREAPVPLQVPGRAVSALPRHLPGLQ